MSGMFLSCTVKGPGSFISYNGPVQAANSAVPCNVSCGASSLELGCHRKLTLLIYLARTRLTSGQLIFEW